MPPVAKIILSASILPFSNTTLLTLLSSISIPQTLEFNLTSTPAFFVSLSSAILTSSALSLVGKYLLPRSSLTDTPSFFKSSIISLLSKFSKALYKNLPFPGILFIKSSISKLLVILHLPFPVIKIFFPKILFFSNKTTLSPDFAALIADIIPAGPPPITTTFITYPLLIILPLL